MSFRFGDFSAAYVWKNIPYMNIWCMVWCLHYIYVDMFIINVPPTLKRSMYDYKLYVSLLIFVYSLMDSDERASLQKNGETKHYQWKHKQYVCIHLMKLFWPHSQCMLHYVVKKNEMKSMNVSVQRLSIKHMRWVGGKLTKLWV